MAKPPPKKENLVQKLHFNHSAGKTSLIEFTSLTDLRAKDSDISSPTRLDFHLLQLVTWGKGRHWVDFEPIKLGRGDVLHIQPSQVHSFDTRSRHEAHLLLFLPESIQDPGLLAPLNFHMVGPIRPKPADFTILLKILELYEFQQASRGTLNVDRLAPYCLGAMIAAIGDLLAHSENGQGRTDSKGAQPLVHKFEILLLEHHASHRDLDWYVSQLHTTARTLARACHQVRGQSPKKLIDARITLEAKRQLILTEDTVEEIAFSLGFSESTNFVKFFKRIAGNTPEGFRKFQID